MHKNTPNYDSNIHFGLPWLLGGALGGQNLDLTVVGGFSHRVKKFKKQNILFLYLINTSPPVMSQNFEIGTLSYPPTLGHFWIVRQF